MFPCFSWCPKHIPSFFPRKTHGHTGGTSLLDVAIAMSLLLAQVAEAPHQLITFSEEPRLVTLPDTEDLTELYRFVQGLDWGYTTNFHKAENG